MLKINETQTGHADTAKKAVCILTKYVVLFTFNFAFWWWFLALIGIEDMPPIGGSDHFGWLLPPKWFFLLTGILAAIEYLTWREVDDMRRRRV